MNASYDGRAMTPTIVKRIHGTDERRDPARCPCCAATVAVPNMLWAAGRTTQTCPACGKVVTFVEPVDATIKVAR